tara:strand:- start:363 stop:773 length:411 start_codon:yes stop_codon:yes gene_type:complete
MTQEKKKKKPDLVVWSEERGYYASQLTYGSNLGAPVIKIDNVAGWKLANVHTVNTEFQARYSELMEQARKLQQEYEWNELIYSSVDYNFQPTVGQTYHLYRRGNGSMMLSIIEPQSWKMEFLGSFRLDSANKWNKL